MDVPRAMIDYYERHSEENRLAGLSLEKTRTQELIALPGRVSAAHRRTAKQGACCAPEAGSWPPPSHAMRRCSTLLDSARTVEQDRPLLGVSPHLLIVGRKIEGYGGRRLPVAEGREGHDHGGAKEAASADRILDQESGRVADGPD